MFRTVSVHLQDSIITPATWYSLKYTKYTVTSHTGHTQKNGAVSEVNKKFISHIIRA
jgi:hypothetical protein